MDGCMVAGTSSGKVGPFIADVEQVGARRGHLG